MAKVIQVIDVDSDGHKVRLDDGRVIRMPHGGQIPHIGQEADEAIVQHLPEYEPELIETPVAVEAEAEIDSSESAE